MNYDPKVTEEALQDLNQIIEKIEQDLVDLADWLYIPEMLDGPLPTWAHPFNWSAFLQVGPSQEVWRTTQHLIAALLHGHLSPPNPARVAFRDRFKIEVKWPVAEDRSFTWHVRHAPHLTYPLVDVSVDHQKFWLASSVIEHSRDLIRSKKVSPR